MVPLTPLDQCFSMLSEAIRGASHSPPDQYFSMLSEAIHGASHSIGSMLLYVV